MARQKNISISPKEVEKDSDLKIRDFLIELSSSQVVLKGDTTTYIEQLDDIYKNDFRHLYSGIFSTITEIDSENQGEKNTSLEILGQNIQIIHDEYNKLDKTLVQKRCVRKLYDHINLDIARINYTKSLESKHDKEKDSLNSNLSTIKKEIEELAEDAKNYQKDYITILGIFAAIIVTFVSGIAFSSSVLSNIDKSSIYRIFAITLTLGFVLLNMLMILTNFILWINSDRTGRYKMLTVYKNLNDNNNLIKKINKFYIFLMGLVLVLWILDLHTLKELLNEHIYTIPLKSN